MLISAWHRKPICKWRLPCRASTRRRHFYAPNYFAATLGSGSSVRSIVDRKLDGSSHRANPALLRLVAIVEGEIRGKAVGIHGILCLREAGKINEAPLVQRERRIAFSRLEIIGGGPAPLFDSMQKIPVERARRGSVLPYLGERNRARSSRIASATRFVPIAVRAAALHSSTSARGPQVCWTWHPGKRKY